jgi:nucleoside-diphosphate-sugar epimerase
MKVVILGGTKYVGLELLKHLKNEDVYVLSRQKISYKNITSIVTQRDSKEELKNHILTIQPEVILDMICYNPPQAQIIVDILTPLTFIKHYIMISTFFIYNYSDKFEEFEEIDSNTMNDNYTRNKYLAEKLISKSDIFKKTTIIRFPFIFSHDDYTKRFQYLIDQAENSNEIIVDNNRCSFISKNDAAKSLAVLIRTEPKQIIDISNQGCISLKAIYLIISNILNKKLVFKEDNRDVYQIQKSICLNSTKATIFNLQTIKKAIKAEVTNYLLNKENK